MSDLREALAYWPEDWQLGNPFDAGTLDVIIPAARKTLDPITDEEVEEAWQSFNAGYVLRSDVRAVLEAFLNGRWPDR